MDRGSGVALVVAVVLLAGCAAVQPTGVPMLFVDNTDETEYRLSVYVLPELEDPDAVTFRATDADGDRRSLRVGDLEGDGSYRNVTLADTDADSRRITVDPGRTTAAAINFWESGDATVYVIETTDGTDSLVGVYVVTCGSADQEHAVTVANARITDRSTTCP
jgi:hypothetical protein